MRALLVLLLLIFIAGCVERNESTNTSLKYKKGDVIYVKPDSLRGTIINSWEGNTKYEVKYFDSEGEEQSMHIEEFEIYGKIH